MSNLQIYLWIVSWWCILSVDHLIVLHEYITYIPRDKSLFGNYINTRSNRRQGNLITSNSHIICTSHRDTTTPIVTRKIIILNQEITNSWLTVSIVDHRHHVVTIFTHNIAGDMSIAGTLCHMNSISSGSIHHIASDEEVGSILSKYTI